MKYMSKFLVILPLFLAACSGGGGGGGATGGGTTTNPTPAPIGIPQFKSNVASGSLFMGLVNVAASKSVTLTVTNVGTNRSDYVKVNKDSATQFSISADLCTGKILQPNESCTISINFTSAVAGGFKSLVVVGDSGRAVSTTAYGYAINFNDVKSLVSEITSAQETGTVFEGAWAQTTNEGQLTSNAVILDALLDSQKFYTSTEFAAFYTPNFVNASPASWKVIDRSLHYLAYNDSDNSVIRFDPSEANTQASTPFEKWVISEKQIPKQQSPTLLYVINKAHKLVNGTDFPNYTALMTKYIGSRHQMNSSGNEIANNNNLLAQVGYLFDTTRQSSNRNYYLENPLKEINLFFDYFASKGDTNSPKDIARPYLVHWLYSVEELQNGTVDPLDFPEFPASYILSYNPTEFQYSGVKVPASNPNISIAQLNYIDFWSHGSANPAFPDSLTCRDYSYTLLDYVSSYNSLGLGDGATKNMVLSELDYAVNSYLPSEAICKKQNGVFAQTSGEEDNALPVILRLYNKAPATIVTVANRISLFNQVATAISSGGSLRGTNSTSLIKAETVKALSELVQ